MGVLDARVGDGAEIAPPVELRAGGNGKSPTPLVKETFQTGAVVQPYPRDLLKLT
jgi:hypothetical protein